MVSCPLAPVSPSLISGIRMYTMLGLYFLPSLSAYAFPLPVTSKPEPLGFTVQEIELPSWLFTARTAWFASVSCFWLLGGRSLSKGTFTQWRYGGQSQVPQFGSVGSYSCR